MSVLLTLLVLAAEAAPTPIMTREADGTVVIHQEITADPAPAELLIEADEDAAGTHDAERERDTRRAFEEAVDQARSGQPF